MARNGNIGEPASTAKASAPAPAENADARLLDNVRPISSARKTANAAAVSSDSKLDSSNRKKASAETAAGSRREAVDDERAYPSGARSRFTGSLTFRITIAMAIVVLVLSLVLAIVIGQFVANSNVPIEVSNRVRLYLLGGGFGGVLLSFVVGALLARKIGEPIRRLNAELQKHDIRNFPAQSASPREFDELEQLSATMGELSTSIRRRERALADSERQFREAFDLVGIGLTQVDPEGRFLVVNRRFCDMLGYDRSELVGKRFVDVTHPADRSPEELSQRAVVDCGVNPGSREKRYLRKDGSVMWAQRSGVVVRDADGRALYGLGSIEDVTEYHASQETLRALNESLRAIVETSPLAIYSLTPNGLVTLWNPAAEKMFGFREAEVLGKGSPIAQYGYASDALELRTRVLAGETVHNYEATRRRADGTPIEVSFSAAPLRGSGTEIVGVLVTCSDITELKRTGRSLDAQLHFNQELLEVIPSPIFYKGQDGRYVGFNRAWEKFMHKQRADWIGKTPHDLLTPSIAALAEAEDERILATGESVVSEELVLSGTGEERLMLKHISRFTSPDGTPAGVIGVMTDITDFKQAEEALRKSEGRFKVLTESAMDIVTVLDVAGTITYQSPSVQHILGIEPAAMVGKCQFDLVHRDDARQMREKFEELVATGVLHKPFEFRARAADGTWRVLEAMGKSCLDVPEIRGVVVNTREITDRRAIEQRIQHLAFHDALTNLPNRSLMQDRISGAIARAERGGKKFAVMYIDIDNFKNINDSLGHDAGDDLLRGVAKRLSDAVRGHDTIARQGGDEFIVLLDELEGHQGATRVAQKVLEGLRGSFKVGGTDQHISGSIGIAVYPDDGRDASSLLKNADTAMFHGKGLGKNTYQFFTPQMNVAVKRRAAMESNLRAAVKNGDFTLVYQPQIDLNTGEIVATEALVRWVSETSGTMMPGEFIPLAEETGLINELGRWVLEEACRQNKKWHDMGYAKRRVAVNLSARQLADKGFIDMLVSVLKRTGLEAEYLELEITESQVMRQGEGSIQLLNEIADMGIHLAVDDFGTGYSSLSYLKRLPITKLKIDQSFVRDVTVDPNDAAIVVAIINMAKSLDLDIIAEGIETAGQLTLLRAKGCGVGQGYFFSVPRSPKDLVPLLTRQSIFEGGALFVPPES
jgi:diguanylate cyclase (GGDEF)-like protein/PAS domain S-box-containing protein